MDTNEIENVVAKYIEGINRSSADALVPLFTQDGVVMAPDAPTMEGAEQLRVFFDHGFRTIKLDAKIFIDEVVVSGNHAFARTHSQVKVKVIQANVTQPEENRELFVFRKDDGAWKIARYMFNKLPGAK